MSLKLRITRWILACISICLVLYATFSIWKLIVDKEGYFNSKSTFKAIAYSETVKASITQKLEASKTVFQGSLLVMGALWGLLIAKKDEKAIVWGDWPELIMFLSANLIFCMSFYCNSLYNDSMANIHAMKAQFVMDFRDNRIENIAAWQTNLWVMAGVVTALTLISAHQFKQATNALPVLQADPPVIVAPGAILVAAPAGTGS